MVFTKKKAKTVDPISDRARALNSQIAALEAEIKRLDTQLQNTPVPKLRSTAIPHGATIARTHEPPPAPEPVFEEVKPVPASDETVTPDQFNELGVRKYDLPALIRRLRQRFSRPVASNPRLVTYLAAGGVRGLRPLRYEKRVARNRFILFAGGLFLLLLGTIIVYLHNH
jgi:type II secretory pathway component PulM